MKLFIPKILLYTRLVLAFTIIRLTYSQTADSKLIVLALIYIGLLSDIFDGILARKLKISTNNLRVHDTIIDLVFYMSILYFMVSKEQQLFLDNITLLIIILSLEFIMYFTSLIRFKKLPSPHAITSKFWGIYLILEFTLILLGVYGTHFTIALYFGLLAHIDRVLIYLILPQWEHDIPSCYHAYRLRKGLTIKRLKIFNG